MSEPEEINPYQTPASESESPSEKPKSTSANVVWMFLVPFLLAHIVYWPIFLIGLYAFRGYGIMGLFMGTGAAVIAGVSYGVWLGLQIRAEGLSTASLHPALYALGQAMWFLFALVAPCSGVLFLAGA